MNFFMTMENSAKGLLFNVFMDSDGLPGYSWDIFEPSRRMSSYLVAFLVSEFTSVESDPALSNVQFRIFARPDARDQMEYYC